MKPRFVALLTGAVLELIRQQGTIAPVVDGRIDDLAA
jgi:hypothetical protein